VNATQLLYQALQIHAKEQSEPLRMFYRAFMKSFTNSQLAFIDETHVKPTDFRRKYGYGFDGLPAFVSLPNSAHGEDIAACGIAAIDYTGLFSFQTYTRTINSDDFYDNLINEVLPKMNSYPNPRSVLVLDNAPTHNPYSS
jgi:hypothetical protein